MDAAPTVEASFAINDPVTRRRARWALAALAAIRGWRLAAPRSGDGAAGPAAYGVAIGVGCEGARITIPYDPHQWQFTREAPDAGRDPLAYTFWWLARVEERVAREASDDQAFDEHGRFLAAAAAGPIGIDVRPVDELAARVLAALDPVPHWPAEHSCAIALTHDIDVPWRWTQRGLRRAARALLNHARCGELRAAGRMACALVAAPAWKLVRSDPWLNARTIARMERQHGATSTSYMITGHHDPYDGDGETYRRVARRYVREVLRSGGEIGLHGSYTTSTMPGRLASERAAAQELAEVPVVSHRYHYLRHAPEHAWPELAAVGFSSDASLGYAEASGFRSGTAFPYIAWDFAREEPLDLFIIPMSLMDATLEPRYSGIAPERAAARDLVVQYVDELATRGGGASVIWHNDKLRGADQRPWTRLYEVLLARGAERGAWMAPTGEITQWWRSRFGDI